jgi:hypothetical protein
MLFALFYLAFCRGKLERAFVLLFRYEIQLTSYVLCLRVQLSRQEGVDRL